MEEKDILTDQELGVLMEQGITMFGVKENPHVYFTRQGAVGVCGLGAIIVGKVGNPIGALKLYESESVIRDENDRLRDGIQICASIIGISKQRAAAIDLLHRKIPAIQIAQGLQEGTYGTALA